MELSKEKISSLREKIERRNSVFKDKKYLDSLFLPSKIIGREKQAEQLIQYINSLKHGLLVPVISIYGRSGAGKSTVIRFVCQNMSDVLSFSFVNLRKAKTVFGCSNLILSELGSVNLKSARLSEMLKKQSAKLEQANEELKEIDTLKDEFVSMISHELKTPVTPILLYSEMLLRRKEKSELDEKQRREVIKIYNNAKNLESLIQDLLDINKLELKKLKLNKSNMEIKEFLENLIENLKSYTLEKNISLILELEKSWIIYCDPQRISQVISNLIKNSVDFVPQDGKITLRVQQIDNSDTMFTVEDNGVGIPPEKADNLFKKFYQADTTLARRHGGTGLGLAICQGIVEAHGGKIWFDKNYKNGARFQFTLPKVAS